MTLMNLGVSPMKGRLVKSAAFSALALSSLAGSVLLSGGDAKACQTGTATLSVLLLPGTGTGTCTIIDPDPLIGVHDKEATIITPINLPGGTNVAFELTGLFSPNSQVQIDTDFNPPLVGPGSIVQQYTVKDLTANRYIDGFDLAFDGMNPVSGINPRVVKDIFDNPNFTGSPILTLSLDGPGSTPVTSVPRRSQYWIRDTFTPGDGSIDNALNTVRNVPGPLPILGAGAAFGFSRKLRGRIKATSAA
jgi:hypothetical protein